MFSNLSTAGCSRSPGAGSGLHEAAATSNRAALAIRDLSVSQGEVVVSRAAGCDYWLLVRDRASRSDRSDPEAGLGIASPGPGPSPSPSPKP